MLDSLPMDPLCAFFIAHMVEVYFFYGLAFFVTGLAVWLETSRSSALPLSRALPFLAAFGLSHGGHEWWEMFGLIASRPPTLLLQCLRLFLLTASFLCLIEFGLRLLSLRGLRIGRWIVVAVFLAGLVGLGLIWGRDLPTWIAAADAWIRYSLAVPGAVLTALGMFGESRALACQQKTVAGDLLIAGMAFLVYGVISQIFVGASALPPSTVINSTLFMELFHVPIQLLRAAMACLVTIFTVRAMRLFEVERQREMKRLDQARLDAQRRLNEEMAQREALQQELLRQVVFTQEEERRVVARELHDEAGQALTALSWGLASVESAMPDGHDEVRAQVVRFRQIADQVMNDLRRLTTRLRPAALDELGLVAALFTYADDCSARYPFTVTMDVTGPRRRLPPEIETTLYRIAQEALTNVAKHANATHARIQLRFAPGQVVLAISDDGSGMDVSAARRSALESGRWGLVGIAERVQLLHGTLDVHSTPGEGTEVVVQVPLNAVPEEETDAIDPLTAGG